MKAELPNKSEAAVGSVDRAHQVVCWDASSRAGGERCPFIWHFPLIFHNRLLLSPDIRLLLIIPLPLMELLEPPWARIWISCLRVRFFFFHSWNSFLVLYKWTRHTGPLLGIWIHVGCKTWAKCTCACKEHERSRAKPPYNKQLCSVIWQNTAMESIWPACPSGTAELAGPLRR